MKLILLFLIGFFIYLITYQIVNNLLTYKEGMEGEEEAGGEGVGVGGGDKKEDSVPKNECTNEALQQLKDQINKLERIVLDDAITLNQFKDKIPKLQDRVNQYAENVKNMKKVTRQSGQ
jgi:hypothetical protein